MATMANRSQVTVIASLVLGFVECVCFAAIFVGWLNLVLVYKQAGLFSHLCENSRRTELNNASESSDPSGCVEVERMFSLCFSLSSAAYQVSSFPIGLIFDRYGFWWTRASATVCFLPGILMLAFAQEGYLAYLIFPGLVLVSIAGMHIIVTASHLTLAARSWKATVTTMFTGGIDAGTVIYLAVKLVYENHGVSHPVSLGFVAGSWLIVIFNTFVCCPRYKLPLGEIVSEKIEQIETVSTEIREEGVLNDMTADCVADQDGIDVTFVACLKTPYLWLIAVWFALLQLRFFFFIGSMNTWLSANTEGDVHRVSSYSNAFSYITFSSLLVSPLAGMMTDALVKRGKRAKSQIPFLSMAKAVSPCLWIGSALAITLSVCVFFFSDAMVYVDLILLQLLRSLLFGPALVYASLVFPSAVFGKCFGFMYFVSVVVGSFQHAFFFWADSPQNFLKVNGIMLILVVFTLMLPIFIEVRTKLITIPSTHPKSLMQPQCTTKL